MTFLLPQLSPGVDTASCHAQGGENHPQALTSPAFPFLGCPQVALASLFPSLFLHSCSHSSGRALWGPAGFEFPFARCRDTDVHTVASLFKLYLRELPEPVVPWLQYEDFLLCGQALEADETKVEMLLFSFSWP